MYTVFFPGLYQKGSAEDRKAALKKLRREGLESARIGFEKRMEARGRSLSSVLVFVGLLLTGQIGLFVWAFNDQRLVAGVAVIVLGIGIVALLAGMVPTRGNIFPRHTGDELIEAAERTDEDLIAELARRSETQRRQVWELRVGMVLSIPLTVLALLLLILLRITAFFA